jgi:hypothetical protein
VVMTPHFYGSNSRVHIHWQFAETHRIPEYSRKS